MNDALRRALADAGLSEDDIAARLDVDPKTVRRWVAGRVPYPRYRSELARLLETEETALWPRLKMSRPTVEQPGAEIIATYPHRASVPRQAWQHLFQSAEREIGILVYAGLFLAEDLGLLRVIADKAREGVSVRILLGNPDGPRIAERGTEEGLGDAMAAKIRNALVYYRPLREIDGIAIRQHDTALYTSIYRADDEIMINPHIYGVPAAQAPVIHLRKASAGDMASTYLDSFERVWSTAEPLG
ncbi:XRE family transcriptional regulator [Thermomonospora amylolytica]|uniref:XRE family transcriptional regulator n=1 Tax=Thermomonospora amylolytica TaxID=1411117 RepID=UPI000E6D44F8|nr:XRE family transcriptional regulator [Thermomonospora amylolytica]